MSGEKSSSPCGRFQANIFNKSKCQNCFKSRELHLLTDRDMEQAKPIYGGWLCLAPEGTDFDNPMQRSRKWQRRFFILYEDGSLSFALDELPSTLPQGTLNMNLCTDIADAEPRTGQKNALCIITPEQEIFIRGENKEIINGWSEQLAGFLRTNKQNQKKKRKVEPVANQEPSPAKMAATDSSFPSSEGNSAESGRWQEDQRGGGPDVTPVWTVSDTDAPGPERPPAGNTSPYLCPVSRDSPTLDAAGGLGSPVGSLDLAVAGSIGAGSDIQTSGNNKKLRPDRSRDRSAERLLGSEATKKEHEWGTAASRKGRSEARTSKREKLQSCGDIAQLSAPPPQRRARSLDRRTSDTVMTPDLLNFKKGWMVKLDENDQWKKYWFVLSTDSLRYYKDSIAEEASDLEGEIDLTKCYNVSEYQVQRNYGFQIHTPKGVCTLSAMTAGIRRNWIQALMRNVHPANAPDVASLPGHQPEVLPKPDVTQDSPSSETDKDPHPKPRSVMERRREGRYKTFDWAEFRPHGRPAVDADPKSPCSLELSDLERRKRREERRRRYESMLGISLGWEEGGDKMVDGGVRALSPKSQQRVEEEIEECWKQVENTVFRLDRTVPLLNEPRVEDLKAQLAESERCRLKLEAQLNAAGFYQQQVEPPVSPEADFYPLDMNEKPVKGQTLTLKDTNLQQQSIIKQDAQEQLGFEPPSVAPQLPSIWLHDTEGNLQELEDLLSETAVTPLLSPASDSDLSQTGAQVMGLNFDGTTTNHQNRLDSEDCQLSPASETQIQNSDFSLLILDKPAGGDETSLIREAPDHLTVKKLSLEVELLTSQNEALNQRNQEMLNQLTEADREIERLKAELSSRYTEPHHLPEVEQQGKTRLEDLEQELSLRNQELLEAQTLITSLEENLKETEVLLQLSDQSEAEEPKDENKTGAEKTEGYLLRCFEATEAKLTELETQLNKSELACSELQQQNTELKEAEELHRQRAAEAEAGIRRLNEELEKEKERVKEEERSKCVSSEEKIQQVIEGMIMRLRALGKLLEVIDRLEFVKESEQEEESPAVVSQLKWEEEFWSLLLNKLKDNSSEVNDPVEVLVREVTEHMMLEKQMLLEGRRLLLEKDEEGFEGMCEVLKDINWNSASVTASDAAKIQESSVFNFNKQLCEMEHLKAVTQMKISLLNHVASSVSTSAQNKFQLAADKLYDFHFSDHSRYISFIHSAATEALYCCRLRRLQAKRGLCCNCVALMEENRELKTRLSNLEEQQASSLVAKMNSCCQTDETDPQDIATELHGADGSAAEESREENETPAQEMAEKEPELNGMETTMLEESDETDLNMELISALRGKVKELEEQLSVLTEELKEQFEGKMSLVQMQHEKEMEKLKTTCERGFACMEESHLKVVEELQRRHQQELERLLVERDRLLEEESAATATAIEAIKNAHRLELQREVERRCQSENSNGNTHLDDIHRQHSEELASFQRELEVLSQQFSLKCLENGHLVQALDAERKALCQCQQENQDLRTRNQELSGHLAAEITRLCSLAKQDDLPLSQGMDMYEMEITLRVKESEVQCLKQEITSLKDELQSAQKDKRNATKKYKDMYTELSIVRAKAEQEAEELRENLRLAHQALGPTSP
ncbi:myosin phosphatase Rho-interacting protein-like isoform X2 [Stegastes partitus]|uniref:Myosin phosphatase Rho-interacting protein-like isoform X2 n=1 Tax=Stegastes partitus TaxID=144197 RepID=A0A9Y4NC51_9TELE|nr:PREDICTED: myosin phosphatase Rho-interacting protein-like isoform X2 [Stegastes partitus]